MVFGIIKATEDCGIFFMLTVTFSVISFVFGVSKYFVIGHMRVIKHNAAAGGLPTGRFAMLMIIHAKFAGRLIVLYRIYDIICTIFCF